MPHPDDELLSALLDGEAPSGDIAHVDECDSCTQRLATLRGVATAVATPVTLPPGHLREASLAIALDTASGKRAARTYVKRWNGLSAAAALIVALAVGGLLITQLGRSDQANDTATTKDAAAFAQTATAEGTGTAGGRASADDATALRAPAESSVAESGESVTDLGEIDDISVVSQRSTEDLAGRDADLPLDALTCPPEATDEPVLWQAQLTYNGTLAVATVRTHSATTRVTEIRDRAGCALLASQEFVPTTPR